MANFSYDRHYGYTNSPYTAAQSNSPYVRLAPEQVFSKVQHARTQYVTSQNDCVSPFVSGVWNVSFDDPYAPNTKVTVVACVSDPNFSPPYTMFNMSAIQLVKDAGGFITGVVGRLTCPFGQVGHALEISVIAIAD